MRREREQLVLSCVPCCPTARARLEKATGQPCVMPAGSIRSRCRRCETSVWVGPNQQLLLEAVKMVLCAECVDLTIGMDKNESPRERRLRELRFGVPVCRKK